MLGGGTKHLSTVNAHPRHLSTASTIKHLSTANTENHTGQQDIMWASATDVDEHGPAGEPIVCSATSVGECGE